MAEFRIDQPGGAGSGVAGESRVDLLPGFVVELHATPVAGATFTWEILDKVNAPVAFLTGTTGLTVNIGSAGVDIPAFCGFMVRLTQNLLGVITVQDRVAAVRSAVAQIRPPLFGEQSPSVQTLNANNPALSTDNAVYPDLAGLGVPGNNPFGWREWAWEIAKALETTAAVVGTPAPIKISGASRQILSIIGSETVIGSFGAFDPTVYADPVLLLEATFVFVPATAGSIEVRLYDMGTRLSPGAGILRSTITATFADVGVLKCISQTLAVTPGPGVNVDEIDPSEVIYEVRAILIGANPGDELELGAVHLVVAPSIGGGGMAAPNSPSFLTLGAAAGLLAERVFTPQKSVVGIDGGAGAAYAVELDGDVAAPGNDMAYSTDGTGAKGWFPKPEPQGPTAFIWSPSNPSPGPGVYTAWADLYAAVNAVPYALRVVTCDAAWDNPELPAGTWNLQGWTFVGTPEGEQPSVTILDGAYITVDTDLDYPPTLSFHDIYVEYQGATAPCIALNNNGLRVFLTDAEIDASNGWPFVDAVSGFVLVRIRGESYLWAPNGDQGVFNGDGDSYLGIRVAADSAYGDAEGSYAGATYLNIQNNSLVSEIVGLSGGTYPQHSGFASIENGALSDYLAYYDGVAPALGATTVQGAIDAIKPLLGGASLTNTAPADVTKAAAAVGVATDAARSDHKHDVATAAPSSVGNANAEGSSSSLARADHVHDHGNLSGGSLHAVAVAGVSDGFISAANQTKLDGIASSATNTPLSSATPANVGVAGAGIGTSVSRDDHVHATPPPYVFSDTLTASDRVFTSWSSLHAIVNALPVGQRKIWFHGTPTIPAGSWNVANFEFYGIGNYDAGGSYSDPTIQGPLSSGAAAQTTVYVANGAVLTASGTVSLRLENINLVGLSTTVANMIYSGNVFLTMVGSRLTGGGTQPIFSTKHMRVSMYRSQMIGGASSVIYVGASYDNDTVVDLYDQSFIDADALKSGGDSATANVDANSRAVTPQTYLSGGLIVYYADKATQVFYDNVLTGAPTLLSTTVQGALDEVKTRPTLGTATPVAVERGNVAAAGTATAAAKEDHVHAFTNAPVMGYASGSTFSWTTATLVQVSYASGTCTVSLDADTTQWPIGETRRLIKDNTTANGADLDPQATHSINGGAANTNMTVPGFTAIGSLTVLVPSVLVTRRSITSWFVHQ